MNRHRKQERDKEKKDAKKKSAKRKKDDGEVYSATSTYRIFSRAACNFVFPTAHKRPLPIKDENIKNVLDKDVGEELLDPNTAASLKELENNPDGMRFLWMI